MITLEDAIRRMTSLPARTFGFRDRGLVREGYWADLVLFDPARVQDKATYQQPHQFSEGFDFVLVNGQPMVEEGKLTEARPGKVLRGTARIMIQLTAAAKRFGPKILFENADWLVTPNDRVGHGGRQRHRQVHAAEDPGGHGRPRRRHASPSQKGITAGYLPQDGLSLSGRTVFDECLSRLRRPAGARAGDGRRSRTAWRSSIPRAPNTRRWRTASTASRREFRARDGYAIEAQVGTVLAAWASPSATGRAAPRSSPAAGRCASRSPSCCCEKPNLLLLDEPTNHLDLEARNWLEDYLDAYPYAFVLVSHDRYFLDVTVRKIVEMWNKGAALLHRQLHPLLSS